MTDISLTRAQKMHIILRLAGELRDTCAGSEDLKTDYQITTRLYSNAFAGLIRLGLMPGCEDRDGTAFLMFELEGRGHSCPARTIKNILKSDFAAVEEAVPEAARLIGEEEARLQASSKGGRNRKGRDA